MGARCGVVTKELFNAYVNQVNVLWKRVKVITMYWEAVKVKGRESSLATIFQVQKMDSKCEP